MSIPADNWNPYTYATTGGTYAATGTNVTDMTIFFPSAPAPTPKTNVEWLRGRVSEICELAQAQ